MIVCNVVFTQAPTLVLGREFKKIQVQGTQSWDM
jgi:hypothetical protein